MGDYTPTTKYKHDEPAPAKVEIKAEPVETKSKQAPKKKAVSKEG